jgi:hypothetical protein
MFQHPLEKPNKFVFHSSDDDQSNNTIDDRIYNGICGITTRREIKRDAKKDLKTRSQPTDNK